MNVEVKKHHINLTPLFQQPVALALNASHPNPRTSSGLQQALVAIS